MLRGPHARHRHADAGGAALAERSRRCLDTGGQVIFGMAGAFAVDLPEALDVLQRHGELAKRLVLGVDRLGAREMQQRIEQHRRMTGRQHEAVAVGPDRILRIEAQELLPQAVGDGRQGHRRPGMAGVCLLNRVNGQRANGVDAEFVDRGHAVVVRQALVEDFARIVDLAAARAGQVAAK